MKKIIMLMFTVLTITVFSCKRDDEVKPSSPTANSDKATLAEQGVSLVPLVVAGSKDHAGYTNATGTNARFNHPYGITVNTDGTLLVADSLNGAIRKIENSVVSTVVKDPLIVGLRNLAVTKDGTIALNHWGNTVLYKNGNLNFLDDPGCPHCSTGGLSKSADGTFFWYNKNLSDGRSEVILRSITVNGDAGPSNGGLIVDSDTEFVYGTAVTTSLHDNKFITLHKSIYQFSHSGNLYPILPNTPFIALTDIVVSNDGTKLYVADNGDIKVINRCSTCQTTLSVLAANVDATGLALAHSEKVLFFTSSKHHTVNKINL
jgi:hypothetical protein